WIGVEHAVESASSAVFKPDESLTPGVLYVSVAALTGSVPAHNQLIFIQFSLPPRLFILSMASSEPAIEIEFR
ncbi:hypothetical protein M422DRAFT_172054, partial [Sphaerobolus stellatus SS14]